MKTMVHLLLVCLASLTVCATSNLNPGRISKFQAPDDDKIYTIKEVDVKAKIKNQMEHLPRRKNDCPDNVSVTLRAVFRMSGKVTDVIIRKSSRCSYDQEAIEAVLQLKFDPAIKDGKQVSQYSDIEFNTTTR
jgi:TonB family protein